MSAILFSGSIGPVPVDVIISEKHSSTLGITENPIESGAKITDHSYVEAKKLTLEFADANAAATYATLVRFQESRVPFSTVTGLRVYTSMLIKSIDVTRDAATSRILSGSCDLQEAIIVSTSYTSTEGEADSAKSNGKAGGKKSTQSARPTKERAGGATPSAKAATADRSSGTAMRGDTAAANVTAGSNENRSVLSRIFQ